MPFMFDYKSKHTYLMEITVANWIIYSYSFMTKYYGKVNGIS